MTIRGELKIKHISVIYVCMCPITLQNTSICHE